MAQYIDKSALVAEIESYKNSFCDRNGYLEDCETNGLAYDTLCELENSIDTLEVKEDVVLNDTISKDLEEAAKQYAKDYLFTAAPTRSLTDHFIAGAQWQKEQFEKNRLEHCDSITEEQYNLETGFIDYYLDKYNRMPTFLDAIEYGMKKAMEE